MCLSMTSNPAIAVHPLVRVPPVMPKNMRLWFSILEEQMKAVDITDDRAKCRALVGCHEPQYLEQIGDVYLSLPAVGR